MMPKVIVHSDYKTVVPISSSLPIDKGGLGSVEQTIEVFQDKYPKKPREPDTIRVLYLCEPPVIKSPRKKLPRHAHDFDYILTFDPWVLKRYPQAHKFVYGTIFTHKTPADREFSISTVVGTKLTSKGHRLRQKFLTRRNKIKTPFRWYFSQQYEEKGVKMPSNGFTLGDDKSPVFTSKFHVAIENCSMPDYFTEKIMDCFVTRTVPIYWGCKNISDYFNTDGIIVCKNLRALVRACNSITPETYTKMQAAMEENYERAQNYIHLGERLARKIEELIVKR